MSDHTPTAKETPTPEEVARLLTRVANLLMRDIHRHLRHVFREPQATMPQMRVLHMAARGRPTLSDVAEALRVTRPTATRLVDGLVQRGWLLREPDPEDRRRIRLRTTPEGEAIRARVQEAVHQAVAEKLQGLDSEVLMALYHGLQGLDDHLRPDARDDA